MDAVRRQANSELRNNKTSRRNTVIEAAKENDNPLAFKLTFSPATEQKNEAGAQVSVNAFQKTVPPFRIRPRVESASKRIAGATRKYDTIVPEDEARRHTDLANDITTDHN